MAKGRYESPEEIGDRVQEITMELKELAAAARQAHKRGEGRQVISVITSPVLMMDLIGACWALGSAMTSIFGKEDTKSTEGKAVSTGEIQ